MRKNRSGNPVILIIGAVAIVLLAVAGLTTHHVVAGQEQTVSTAGKA